MVVVGPEKAVTARMGDNGFRNDDLLHSDDDGDKSNYDDL